MGASDAGSETVVCILGAPRSGTSLTTRILNLCGLYLGRSDELIPAGPSNSMGFWELRQAVHLNERILVAMGGDRIAAPYLPQGWEKTLDLAVERERARELLADVFAGQPKWGWKDPRNSFTVPFWRGLVPEMRYVICLRNPLETAASGVRMAAGLPDLNRGRALELWERYIASAIVNTSGRPRLFVAYEDYFEDWRAAADRLARFAGLDPPTGTGREQAIGDLIDRRLRHQLSSTDEALRGGELPPGARCLYSALLDRLRSDSASGNGSTETGDDANLDRLAHDLLAGENRPPGDEEIKNARPLRHHPSPAPADRALRIVALLATYNERRFIGPCIEHLRAHGIDTYLIDNCSTDETVEIAEGYLGNGLIGIESLPREERMFKLLPQLRRKEELAEELEADWFIHLDADEIRPAPPGYGSLADALATVDRQGYNAVNFVEFTFIPTREEPDHDHDEFQQTLRTYYPFAPTFPHQLKAWKATDGVQLARSGGHRVKFAGLRMYPESFPMKHYQFLSVPHAIEKYVQRTYDPKEVELGGHGWRAQAIAEDLRLPSEAELRIATSGKALDHSNPRPCHYVEDVICRRPDRIGR
jgi:Sulfotransferase family/Glycosyl transferase family 2